MNIRRAAAILLATVLALALTGSPAAAQTAGSRWAPAGQASIYPGVQSVSESGQCTAAFVFHDDHDVYIAQAAHCTGTGRADETNGCRTGVLPLGTEVRIGGASLPGRVVYNSWLTMQAVGETDGNVCLGNDFALVRIDRADHARVNPSVPFFGGPTGIDPDTRTLEPVYGYGNSGLRGGIQALSPKAGVATGDQLGGWNHDVYTVSPGVPGDSGSAYLGPTGGALGVLSTFSLTLSNQVTDLSRALAYMKTHTDHLDGVRLALGTEPFSPIF